jgi:hypothetical protein
MAFLLLVVEHEARRESPPETRQKRFDEMMAYTEDLRRRGVLLGSESLRPDSEGARVRRRDGQRIVTDGPFAESKEMVGGFFLLDCTTKERAVALAAECPASGWATVEVRETGGCSRAPFAKRAAFQRRMGWSGYGIATATRSESLLVAV